MGRERDLSPAGHLCPPNYMNGYLPLTFPNGSLPEETSINGCLPSEPNRYFACFPNYKNGCLPAMTIYMLGVCPHKINGRLPDNYMVLRVFPRQVWCYVAALVLDKYGARQRVS